MKNFILTQKRKIGPPVNRGLGFSQSGQVLVEYVLLLIVIVALVMSLMKVFFQPYSNFMTNYLGEYLMCVLETAELPGMNATSDSGSCTNKLNMAAAGGAKGKNGAKGSNDQDANDPNADSGNKDKDTADANSGTSGRGGRGGGGRNGNNANALRFKSSASPAAMGEGTPAPQEVEGMDGGGRDSKTSFSGRRSRTRIVRIRATGLGGAIEFEREKAKKAEAKVTKVGKADDSVGGTASKRLRVNKVNRSTASDEAKIEPFSLGKWLKILFIAAVIIAIFVFLFMQFNSISKSWEK